MYNLIVSERNFNSRSEHLDAAELLLVIFESALCYLSSEYYGLYTGTWTALVQYTKKRTQPGKTLLL